MMLHLIRLLKTSALTTPDRMTEWSCALHQFVAVKH